jgi:hypothetical protein
MLLLLLRIFSCFCVLLLLPSLLRSQHQQPRRCCEPAAL